MKNLIGISGHMGSGKDTVGTIIQYLQDEGEWYSFDDFVANSYPELASEWKIRKFADKLKDIVCILIGCTREQLEDPVFKNTPMNSDWDDSHGISTPRELLQILGTNCGRDMIHTNIWVNALFADYKPIDNRSLQDPAAEDTFPNWIITDMRFPNELEAVVKREGLTIRVRRDTKEYFQLKNRNGSITHATLHPSETALDDATFDYIINNNGTISDLIEDVRRILIHERIIK